MAIQLLDPITASIEQVLDLRSRQQAMTVANLANEDTPNYRARHIDFARSLENLMRAAEARRANPGTRIDREAQLVVELEEPPAWSANGNSVDRQREMATLSTNNVYYSATVELLNRRMGLLGYALTEGKGR